MSNPWVEQFDKKPPIPEGASNPWVAQFDAKPPTPSAQPDKWIAQYPGIQQHAIALFLNGSPAMQEAVMARGTLDGARDPTAVLMSRISKAQFSGGAVDPVRGLKRPREEPMSQASWNWMGQSLGSYADGGTDAESWLDSFPGIDDKARSMFRQAPPDVQQAVIAKGSLNSARDQTAVLIARIRKCSEGSGKGYGQQVYGKGAGLGSSASSWEQGGSDDWNDPATMTAMFNGMQHMFMCMKGMKGKKGGFGKGLDTSASAWEQGGSDGWNDPATMPAMSMCMKGMKGKKGGFGKGCDAWSSGDSWSSKGCDAWSSWDNWSSKGGSW